MISGRRLIVLLTLMLCIVTPLALSIPAEDVSLDSYVNDQAGVISQNATVALTALLESLHENGTAQMTILAVDSLEGLTKEQYALEVAHENLGNAETDNGLLLLVAVEERKYRVEVGYGLEGRLNDAKVGRMARNTLVPYLEKDLYGAGMVEFTKSVYVELTGDESFSAVSSPVSLNQTPQRPWWSQLGILPFLVVFMVFRGILGAIASSSSQSKKGSSRHRNTGDEAFGAALLASMFLRGGGGGLGGAGGGFGGFGGGGFGGGGAGGGF